MLKQSKRLLRMLVCLGFAFFLFLSSSNSVQAQNLILANTQVQHTPYIFRTIESGGSVLVGCAGVVVGVSAFFPPAAAVGVPLCSGLAFHATIPPFLMTDEEYSQYAHALSIVRKMSAAGTAAKTITSMPQLSPQSR